MLWSRVEERILASKVRDGIYELRNLELGWVAGVSDQHKPCCPGKSEGLRRPLPGAGLRGLQAPRHHLQLRFRRAALVPDLGRKCKGLVFSLVLDSTEIPYL